MLIGRLIYAFRVLVSEHREFCYDVISYIRYWRLIKSGVQVSVRYSADLKEREKIPHKKKGVITALRGKVSAG